MRHYITIYQTTEDEPRRDETLVFDQRFVEAASDENAVTLLLIELAADRWGFPDSGIAHALSAPEDCSGMKRFELDLDFLGVKEVGLS